MATPLERFMAKTAVGPKPDGQRSHCLLWTGALTTGRHGKRPAFWFKGRTVRAHRWIYEQLVRPLKDGETLDHLCGEILCVNVGHLDPCSNEENASRGSGPHFELRGLDTFNVEEFDGVYF